VHRVLVLGLALGLAGCVLHLSDDTACSDDDASRSGGDVINPASLACEHFGSAPCGELDPAVPTWGRCDSGCRALDEATCIADSSCHGAYDHNCLFGTGPCPAATAFLGCYPLDRNPDFITGCAGLDAWNCSRHAQCFSTYRGGSECRDGVDQDGDGSVDEPDECALGFVRCLEEPQPQL